MNPTFRGLEVTEVWIDHKANEYVLLGPDSEVIAHLRPREFLAQPQLRKLGVKSGKYRRPDPTNNSGASNGAGAGSRGATAASVAALYAAAKAARYAAAYGGRRAGLRSRAAFNMPSGITWLSPQQWKQLMQSRGLTVGMDFGIEHVIPHEGIRAGEIIGHRCWRVRGGSLCSTYMKEVVWEPGEVMNAGTSMFEQGVGVHAFKNLSPEFYEYVASYSDAHRFDCIERIEHKVTPCDTLAVGTVKMWGEVVEHEHGWRSEFAKINSIGVIVPHREIEHKCNSAENPDELESYKIWLLAHLRLTYGVTE